MVGNGIGAHNATSAGMGYLRLPRRVESTITHLGIAEVSQFCPQFLGFSDHESGEIDRIAVQAESRGTLTLHVLGPEGEAAGSASES